MTATTATTTAAWQAWQAGDFVAAGARARELVLGRAAANEGNHVAALMALVTGDFRGALAAYAGIEGRYRRRRELDAPMLWAHLLGDDLPGSPSAP